MSAKQADANAQSHAAQRTSSSLRALPSVDEVLRLLTTRNVAPASPTRSTGVRFVRQAIAEARASILAGSPCPDVSTLADRALALLEAQSQPLLRPVINATGVLINTNLGRAPLSNAAIAAIVAVAQGYSNLEYDLHAGTRGSRHTHIRQLLRDLTGAEDALVVNNNAAAVLVVLSALAAGREVVVSRGELVEIGGGFRVPDVLRQGGARLVEVGTTNRTRLRDYEAAITPDTAVFLAVHPSNFRVVGFTETPELAALARLAHERHILLVHDLGSGCLGATERWGLAHEPTIGESVAAGADITCFSGDKLLGGPQAGLIVGRAHLLDQIARHPLMRAVRIDKLSLAALEATLRQHLEGVAEREIPLWRSLATPLDAIHERALRWVETLRESGLSAEVVPGSSTVGGGSLPGETLPTMLCAIPAQQPAFRLDLDALSARLRAGSMAVVARVSRDTLLLDPRTVFPEQDPIVRTALHTAMKQTPHS